jgi:hypothetical protein
MPRTNWNRARHRDLGTSQTSRLDRLADQWLTTNKARPRPDKDDEIIMTCGMKPDGTLLVLRFKTRAECDAWCQKTKLGSE